MTSISRRTLFKSMAGDWRRPNVIHINVDTWGTGWLGCYGNQEIQTPRVDALAERSLLFRDAYPQALPTIPARRVIYTGRQAFPSMMVYQPDDAAKIRGWHQLYAEDVTMSETLGNAGYTTGFLSDLYHQFKPGKNFTRGFQSWQYIRGQEIDGLESGPRQGINLLDWIHPSQIPPPGTVGAGAILMQYLMNRQFWQTEEDWPCARLFAQAERWLEDSVEDNQPFYLHIESYSPHEMWDPPPGYYELYMKSDYRGPRIIFPPATTARMKPVEIEHARALYAGMITFVDSRIGRFLAKVEQLGLLDNTIIVFLADHGIMMGEQGQMHKSEGSLRTQLTHIPLIIYYPRGAWAGRKFDGFVQHTDLMPTLLDILGVERPERVTGESLKPCIDAGGASPREWIFGGWDNHGFMRSKELLYIGRWNPGEAWEQIYEVRKDPLELTNVIGNYQSAAPAFRSALKDYVDSSWAITKGTFAIVGPS